MASHSLTGVIQKDDTVSDETTLLPISNDEELKYIFYIFKSL